MHTPPLVLVVDDEDSFREIISARIKAAGLDVAIAKDGDDGIKKADELMPDLILMDVHMPPGPNGTDAALAIKQNEKTRNIPIAFLTSLKEPWPGIAGDNREVSRELGMEDYFDKTTDMEQIGQKAIEILQRHTQSAQ